MTSVCESVNLDNCHREPIHILGSVQQFGALIAVDSHFVVRHASASLEDHLGMTAAGATGKPLAELLGSNAIAQLVQRSEMLEADSVERMFDLAGATPGENFSAAIYRSSGLLVIELEPAFPDPSIEAASAVRTMMARLNSAPYPDELFDEAARQIRMLTGFDRVMVYRFLPDGSGAVVAEARASAVDSFLGLRYPASDIPSQARELYKKNWLRIIADVDSAPSPILPQTTASGSPLDLTLSVLRSVSPIHIEYLKNMGVKASLSISIVVGGQLWGLIACHHYAARILSFERRTAAEIFGNMLSLSIAAREREVEQSSQARARARIAALLSTMSEAGKATDPIIASLDDIGKVIASDSVALGAETGIVSKGMAPAEEDILQVVRFLRTSGVTHLFSIDRLADVIPEAVNFSDRAAGVLAIPVSRDPRDYILFFRRELKQAVHWAGNPDKPVQLGPHGSRLTPRESFAEWKQTVEHTCEAWSQADLALANELRVSVQDIVLRMTDARERERAQAMERQELLIAELNHRVRNILGLVRGIVRQSRSGTASVEAFANTLFQRISSLSRAHDNINGSGGGNASLTNLIRTEADAYLSEKATRVILEGPSVWLDPNANSTLALVLHELITNAAKYGALSDRHGTIDIAWEKDERGDLLLRWRESGGPAVRPPARKGFGTTLIARSIPYDLGGEIEHRFHMSGVRASMRIPAKYVSFEASDLPEQTAQQAKTYAEMQESGTYGLLERVLIVEDSMILALDLEDQLRDLGARSIDLAGNVADSLRVMDRGKLTFAVLDVNLGHETSYPVARALNKLGVPFIFASGYGEQAVAEVEDIGHAAVVTKPISPDRLAEVIRKTAGGE
ncbi:MAG: HWE histidine kinase domain-containing protein [Beijerinckiaceae bacterium]